MRVDFENVRAFFLRGQSKLSIIIRRLYWAGFDCNYLYINRLFYSCQLSCVLDEWKRGGRWLCFDTNHPAFQFSLFPSIFWLPYARLQIWQLTGKCCYRTYMKVWVWWLSEPLGFLVGHHNTNYVESKCRQWTRKSKIK